MFNTLHASKIHINKAINTQVLESIETFTIDQSSTKQSHAIVKCYECNMQAEVIDVGGAAERACSAGSTTLWLMFFDSFSMDDCWIWIEYSMLFLFLSALEWL